MLIKQSKCSCLKMRMQDSHNTKNDNTVQQILTYFLLWRLNMFPVTDFVMLNMKMVINSLD